VFVRWQWYGDRRRKSGRHWWRVQAADAHAVLVESYRVDGKPRQRHVAYLGSVHSDLDVHDRAWFWHRMNAKLDALSNRIPAAERPKIEAALAAKVPPVTAEEVTAFDLQRQHRIRVEHGLGECPGCYLGWPEGQKGVPPRPDFSKRKPFASVLAAVTGS
jgi:hypothetical protein